MSKCFDMLRLPYASMPPDCIIAWRDGHPVYNETFQLRVYAWRALLEHTPGNKFALHSTDSLEFASALYGGWLAGKTLYLPGNTLPATCKALHDEVDGYLGTFTPNWLPLTPTALEVTTLDTNYLIPDFAGLVIYTSGSTGDPQAIPKRLSQLAAEVATLETLFGSIIGHADIVATVSHEHIYGLLFKVLWPLTAGRAIHVRSAVFLEELAPILTTRDCVLVSSPAHLKRFSASLASMMVSNHIRAVFSSGSPLPLEVAYATEQLLGQMPLEVYGSSETGGIAWRQRGSHLQEDESWQPMPGITWRTTSSEDNVLEICSPHLPDSDWFRTADRAIPAQNSRFILTGRTDRIVKLEGKRISPDAIERCLILSPLVVAVRVLMLDQSEQRQRIAAFVVLSKEGNAQLIKFGKRMVNQQLRKLLMDSVEPIALPRSWRYLDALPVNAQGKTTRAELIALLTPASSSTCPTVPRGRLVEQHAHRAVFELTVPPDLFYFDGHFPGAPILPGVVQCDWAIAYGRKYFDLPTFFRGIHALKFQSLIQPGMTVMLELLYNTAKFTLTFRFYSQAEHYASGRILFGISSEGLESL